MRNVRRLQVQQKKKRRNMVFITFGVLILFYLTINMIIGENGLFRYFQLKMTKEQFQAETVMIKDQTDDVRNQIELLDKKPHEFEGYAREYGLTKEGELVFKFEERE